LNLTLQRRAMALRLVQFLDAAADRRVALVGEDGAARTVKGCASTYALAMRAIEQGQTLAQAAADLELGEAVDVAAALAHGRLLPPIDHPDPAHLYMTGTGLTHLGSAEGRDKMHRKAQAAEETLTDSMKMFRMGLEGGKPTGGGPGVQPEWFYKGDGSGLTASGRPLASPNFALDAGEEPEIAGLYVIGPGGSPFRVGYALANEFSDHVTERGNYLWLAHSKLRPASVGPEVLVGDLPADVRGKVRILRDGTPVWEADFLSGEANMSHALANLEHHHFKYGLFRRPGDVHVHFFGTATLSFSEGVKVEPGDVFEIEAAPFRYPLRNPLRVAEPEEVTVRAL
jgi:hypothetical protein